MSYASADWGKSMPNNSDMRWEKSETGYRLSFVKPVISDEFIVRKSALNSNDKNSFIKATTTTTANRQPTLEEMQHLGISAHQYAEQRWEQTQSRLNKGYLDYTNTMQLPSNVFMPVKETSDRPIMAPMVPLAASPNPMVWMNAERTNGTPWFDSSLNARQKVVNTIPSQVVQKLPDALLYKPV